MNLSEQSVDVNINKMIQRWLNFYACCNLNVDGVIGPKTRKGVIRALQHALNCSYACQLEIDGSFGPLTKAACSKITLKRNDCGNMVSLIQALLYITNHNPSGFNGIYGNELVEAIRQVQGEMDIPVDGVCRGNLVISLIQTGGIV